MTASLGDYFPDKDKADFAVRNIAIGNVIYCPSKIAEKDKRLVIIGISKDGLSAACLLFNTDKYFTRNKELGALELHFDSVGREYLDHPSFLNCVKLEIIPCSSIEERLKKNPEDFKGTMNQKDLDLACTTMVNARTAIPKQIVTFGLEGYKVTKKGVTINDPLS